MQTMLNSRRQRGGFCRGDFPDMTTFGGGEMTQGTSCVPLWVDDAGVLWGRGSGRTPLGRWLYKYDPVTGTTTQITTGPAAGGAMINSGSIFSVVVVPGTSQQTILVSVAIDLGAGSLWNGILLRSANGGATWTEIYNPVWSGQPFFLNGCANTWNVAVSGNTVLLGTYGYKDAGANYTLNGAVSAGATTIPLTATTNMYVGSCIGIADTGAGADTDRYVTAITAGVSVTVTPAISYNHANAANVRRGVSRDAYKSTDAGATWARAFQAAPVASGSTDQDRLHIHLVSIDPTGNWWVSVGDSPNSAKTGLYKSTDAGLNWTLVVDMASMYGPLRVQFNEAGDTGYWGHDSNGDSNVGSLPVTAGAGSSFTSKLDMNSTDHGGPWGFFEKISAQAPRTTPRLVAIAPGEGGTQVLSAWVSDDEGETWRLARTMPGLWSSTTLGEGSRIAAAAGHGPNDWLWAANSSAIYPAPQRFRIPKKRITA